MNLFLNLKKRYAIPENPFSLPTTSTSDSFNALVKSILKSVNEEEDNNDLNEDLMSVEFDFYINGEFFYGTFASFIQENESIKTVSVVRLKL